LPESSSSDTEDEEAEAPVVFEDQTVRPEPSRRRRLPPVLSTITPEVLVSGVSRLATQQIASGDAVNQTPRYLLVDSPVREKNPNVNEPPAETTSSPSVMLPPLLSVPGAMLQTEGRNRSVEKMREGR
jgi:hypothetical protein